MLNYQKATTSNNHLKRPEFMFANLQLLKPLSIHHPTSTVERSVHTTWAPTDGSVGRNHATTCSIVAQDQYWMIAVGIAIPVISWAYSVFFRYLRLATHFRPNAPRDICQHRGDDIAGDEIDGLQRLVLGVGRVDSLVFVCLSWFKSKYMCKHMQI